MTDTQTLYKLIVLFMLSRVDFPLTKTQISDYILERGYTNFITLSQILSELESSALIQVKITRNRTYLHLTEEGRNSLSYFDNRISSEIKSDIELYLKSNELKLRNEVSVSADYYKSTNGEYIAELSAKEKSAELINLKMTFPTEELASFVCDKWLQSNEELYQMIIKHLFE